MCSPEVSTGTVVSEECPASSFRIYHGSSIFPGSFGDNLSNYKSVMSKKNKIAITTDVRNTNLIL
jgi:hypothetical protein